MKLKACKAFLVSNAASFLFTALAAWGTFVWFRRPAACALLAIPFWLLCTRALRCGGRKRIAICAAFACAFSLSVVLKAVCGGQFNARGWETDLSGFPGLCAFFYVLLIAASAWMLRFSFARTEKPPGRRWFFIFWAVLLLCCLPYFIAYYPAFMVPDSYTQVAQATGTAPLSNWHPVLHTLFIGACLSAGSLFGTNPDAGAAVYSALQMLMLTAAFACAVRFIAKQGAPRWLTAAALAFFALFPLNGAYSVTMEKDVLFGAAALLLTVKVCQIIFSKGQYLKKPAGIIGFAAAMLAVAFFRNNGIYVLIFTLIFLLIATWKWTKRASAVSLAVIVAAALIQGPGYAALGVQKSPLSESLAVPIQQVAAVVAANGNVTPAQMERIDRVVTDVVIKREYQPYDVDPIKYSPYFSAAPIEQDKLAYLGLWAQLCAQNPAVAAKAWLCETQGVWAVDLSAAAPLGTGVNIPDGKGVSASLRALFSKIPVPKYTGYLFWIMLLLAAVCLLRGHRRMLAAFAPVFGVWASLMLAIPYSFDVRYMYAFVTVLPVAVMLALADRPVLQDQPAPRETNESQGADPARRRIECAKSPFVRCARQVLSIYGRLSVT